MKQKRYQVILAMILAGLTLVLIFCHVPMRIDPSASPAGKKTVPEITFRNLTPPFLDYVYFEGSKDHPFEVDADAFSLVNAWWLAEAATLVYADEDFVRFYFKKAGLPDVVFFNRLGTQCFAASNDRFALIAFRGSEIWKKREGFELKKILADLKTDIDFRPAAWAPQGKVHQGFKDALEEIWPDLFAHLTKLDREGINIWVTGHSLGAALATLCGARYGKVRGVYSFGSPKVGDEEFRRHLDVSIYRVVNNDDIVPRLFIPGPYVHVGELELLDENGTLVNSPAQWQERSFPAPGEDLGDDAPGLSAKKDFEGFVPRAIRDHVPLLYAIHLWNNLVETGGDRRGASQ